MLNNVCQSRATEKACETLPSLHDKTPVFLLVKGFVPVEFIRPGRLIPHFLQPGLQHFFVLEVLQLAACHGVSLSAQSST